MATPLPVPDERRGSSWPLMLLAALSLIPFLGFFFGFAAACWGLVTDRPRGILAAALGGAGAIINIAVLGAIGMSIASKSHSGGITALLAQSELDTLANHIDLYHLDHQRYPEKLADLPRPGIGQTLPLIDHSIGLLNMKTEYWYRVEDDGSGYDLRGVGKDGLVDTDDDVFPNASAADPWPADSAGPTPEAVEDD